VNSGRSIHASAVLVGPHAVLLRGPSGAGKSRLALELIQAAPSKFTRLVADDRVYVETAHGRLLVRPAPSLAGLIEVRGLGIIRLPYEPVAVATLVLDLGSPTERMPGEAAVHTSIEGVKLPRLAVAAGYSFSTVVAALTSDRSPQPELAAAVDTAMQELPPNRLHSGFGWSR
jgi:HPr kinase/phosphorylase